MEEDVAKNVSLSLHNLFCLKRESEMKVLPDQAKRLQEQREWMRAYEQLRAWEENLISSDDKKNYRGKLRCQVHPDRVPLRRGRELRRVLRSWLVSIERERKRGLSVSSDEI